MAVVRLTDVIIPEVYQSYGQVNSPELTRFLASGVVQQDARLNAFAEGPSKTGTIPYWLDLDQTVEQNYSNDDPADLSSPQKIAMADLSYRTSYLNQSWSDMDLVVELAGADPMAQIRRRTSTYWLRRLQKRIIAIARGLYAENVANDSSDMVINIAAEATGGQSASTRFNAASFIDAAFTLGDAAGGLTAIGVHSHTKAQMLKNDEIDFIRDSEGNLLMETYKGLTVITDDSLPVRAGTTSGYVYTSILFGRGVFGLGVGTPKVPVETIRVPAAGNGGGMETLHERKTWLLHPVGHDWVEGTLTEFSPTDADLASAAHWDRVYDRKQVPMAFMVHN